MKKAIKIPLIIVGILFVIFISTTVLKICPPQGPWPMPPWCEEAKGVKEQRETIYHEGDFVIDQGKTHLIENKILQLNGNLVVRKNSTLIVNNSKIILNLRFFGEYWAEVSENSKFIVENSVLERTGYHNVCFLVNPGSETVIKNTVSGWDICNAGKILLQGYDATSARNGIFFRTGEITAINSKFRTVSLHNIGADESQTLLSLDGLKKGFISELIIKREDGILTLKNSELKHWVVDVGSGISKTYTSVRISNSDIWGLWLWFHPESNVTIKDIKPGFYKYWNMDNFGSFDDIGYDVELINTSVEWFKLQIIGQATVENSSGIQIGTRGKSNAHVKNSKIGRDLIMRGNEKVILENSIVNCCNLQSVEDRSPYQFDLGRGGTERTLELRNAVIKTPLEIGANYTKISGEGRFSIGIVSKLISRRIDLGDINFVFGKVEREYPVIIKDSRGKPVPSLYLTLRDSNGEKVWEGLTDENGKASFSITFDKESYKKEFVIQAENSRKKVDFLTETPINLRI